MITPICRCNNCYRHYIDTNPKVFSRKYDLNEIPYKLTRLVNRECPLCKTDGYLVDRSVLPSLLIKDMRETQPSKDGWISIGERLPDENVDVIIGGKDFVYYGFYSGITWYHVDSGILKGVTHWMIKPELPKPPS